MAISSQDDRDKEIKELEIKELKEDVDSLALENILLNQRINYVKIDLIKVTPEILDLSKKSIDEIKRINEEFQKKLKNIEDKLKLIKKEIKGRNEEKKLLNRFSEYEILILISLDKYSEIIENEFFLDDYNKTSEYFKKNTTLTQIVSIRNINFLERIIDINGTNRSFNFITSIFDMEKLKRLLDSNIETVLAKVKIRKHQKDTFFIENIEILLLNEEELYTQILTYRNSFSTKEWKDFLLHCLGYNLSESKSILKDLMLVRAIPYVEKNYSYIELGPYSTGKTSFSELFTTGEKIATNISMAQLYYNVKEKKDGLLFKKDVLYLDEADFSDLGAEESRVLLQVLSGNKINVRDSSISKNTDVSIVSQGNVLKGMEEYIEGDIFERFKKSFNPGAFFDRTNFFIAGWLIPIYENIKADNKENNIPIIFLEKVFKRLRNLDIYDKFINNNYEIVLISNNTNQGRFIRGIKTTISGFLKLLYLGQEIDIEKEQEEIEKIIVLSILGKYAIYHKTFETSECRVEVYYKGKKKISLNIKNLIDDYILSKEDQYFETKLKDNLPNETDDSFENNRVYWENDNTNTLESKRILRKYKKEKITSFPKEYEHLLKMLEDYEIKEKYEEFYRIVVTYDINDYLDEYYSEEIQKERDEFLYAYVAILKLFNEFSYYKISGETKNFIENFLNIMNNKKELYDWKLKNNEEKEKLKIGNIITRKLNLDSEELHAITDLSSSESFYDKIFEIHKLIKNKLYEDNNIEFDLKNIRKNIKDKFNYNYTKIGKSEDGKTRIEFALKEETKQFQTLHEELMNI